MGKVQEGSESPSENGSTLPTRFQPRFWSDADQRVALVRELKGKVNQLKTDTNADSYPKEILCERAVFLLAVIETQEVTAVEGESKLDLAAYVQAVNSLLGLLRTLGLERKAKKVETLDTYVEKRARGVA